MSSVHGITVAGGTFPATIWNLFMSQAFEGVRYRSWPAPRNPAVFVPFSGQYQFYGEPPPPKAPKKEKGKKVKKEDDKSPSKSTEPPPTETEPPTTTTP
jgi:penicillin-binding protein 1A